MSFAVFVTFRIAECTGEQFMERMRQQARDSLEKEPECSVFEIWTSSAEPEVVRLYEVYDRPSSFEAHLASDHFKAFDRDVGPMITDRVIATCDRREPS